MDVVKLEKHLFVFAYIDTGLQEMKPLAQYDIELFRSSTPSLALRLANCLSHGFIIVRYLTLCVFLFQTGG